MIALGRENTGLIRTPHHPSCPARYDTLGCICPPPAEASSGGGRGTPAPTLGERYDALAARMDAAYAERRLCSTGSPEYAAADVAIEAAYAELRVLNELAKSPGSAA